MKTIEQALAPFAGQYSDAFLKTMAFTLPWECEFIHGHQDDYDFVRLENVPGDSGGPTKYGVDTTNHPGLDIANLDLAGALDDYHNGYVHNGQLCGGEWKQVHGDDLPPDVALTVFDAAMNVGVKHAVKWMQESVGAEQDGIIGQQTLTAVANAQSGLVDSLVDKYRDAYYEALANAHSNDVQFLDGWLGRVADLEKSVGNLPDVPNVAQIA